MICGQEGRTRHDRSLLPAALDATSPVSDGGGLRQAARGAARKGLKLLVRCSKMPASATVIAVVGAEGLS